MITAKRLLLKCVTVLPAAGIRLAAGFTSAGVLKQVGDDEVKVAREIFGVQQAIDTQNPNIQLAVKFAEEDNISRAIQELQIASRRFDLSDSTKLSIKTQENTNFKEAVRETLLQMFRSSKFNSLEFPSLLDSLVIFLENHMLTKEALGQTCEFALANIEEVNRLAYETSNFRIVYYLFTLLSKYDPPNLLGEDQTNKMPVMLRDKLIDSLLEHIQVTEKLQLYESVNLMISIIETEKFRGDVTGKISQLIHPMLQAASLKVTSKSHVCLLMAIVSRLSNPKPEILKALSSSFNAMDQDKSKELILAHLRKNHIEFLFVSLSAIEKYFPREVLVIYNKLKGYLATNIYTMAFVLRYISHNNNKFLVNIVNEEIELMLQLNLLRKLSEHNRMMFLSLACIHLCKKNLFEHFGIRDKLLLLYYEGLVEFSLESLDLSFFADYFYLMNILRFSTSPILVKVVDRLLSKVRQSKEQSLSLIKLLSSMANTDVVAATHPILEELALRILSSKNLPEYLVEKSHTRAFFGSVEMWYYKLWRRLKEDPTTKVSPAFGLMVQTLLDIYNYIIKNKVKLDTKEINKLAQTLEELVVFGYFDSDLAMKAKIQSIVDGLTDALVSSSMFFTQQLGKHASKDNSAENLFKDILTSRGIAFEAEKRIGLSLVDFYLPEFNAVIELNGLVHFARTLQREPLLKTLKKKDFLKQKGYIVYSLYTTSKDEQSKLTKRLNKLIDIILDNKLKGIVPTSYEDPTNTN